MNKSNQIIISIITIVLVTWMGYIYLNPIILNPFPIRKELINITGALSFVLMSFIIFLAIRPKWLEHYIGLDKMYHLHKWAGIWSIIFAALHYGIKLGKPILTFFFIQAPKFKGIKNNLTGLAEFFHQYSSIAKDIGEFVVYILALMLILALWRSFSYKIWRYTHKLMAPLYLLIAFHGLILTPWSYWVHPIGFLVALSMVIGSICALISMFGLIGKKMDHSGKVIAINELNECIEVTCKLNTNWQHKAGQYAFFKHDKLEGAHPFTISSDDHGDNTVRFTIKSLGRYTKYLQKNIHIGDLVKIEGPYGLFDYQRSTSLNQIWIAGGIGITPFIAWLESMIKNHDNSTKVDLYYCVNNKDGAVYKEKLETLCDQLPNVHLYCHYSDEKGYLTTSVLKEKASRQVSDIWFCGPQSFANSIRSALKKETQNKVPIFHNEFFQMR